MTTHTDIVMYGIPNCDTIKKAKKWLTDQGVDFQFHNYKKDGVDSAQLKRWVNIVGWEPLLNKRGTTWRQLDDQIKSQVNESSAITIMLDNPSIIKRPVVEVNDTLLVGFNADEYAENFTE